MADPDSSRFRFRSNWSQAFLLPAGLYAMFSTPMTTVGSWERVAVVTAGWCFFLLGTHLRIWSTLYIGGRKSHGLITGGPYAFCRNPLYLGSICLMLSGACYLESMEFVLAVILSAVVYVLAVVPQEEVFLLDRFGSAYLEYCKRTPRFWPSLSSGAPSHVVPVDSKALRSEWKRALLWVWIPLLGRVAHLLRWKPWWPHWP